MSATITLRMPHPGQQEILKSPARFKVLACGRRWGKSELGLIDILRAAHLEHKRCWWVAPSYQMADQIWRDLVNAVKHLKDVVISRTQRRIDLPKGGVIAIRSAHNPDKLRGDGLDFVVLDEAARMPARIWHDVIRPMLAKTRGAARFLSTPKGRNWFWERHRDGDDPLQEEWQSFHYPTAQSQLVDP
ncbi:MAG: terminase family protein, partial [Chloroflexi bacterium]|nr:terminase family protein [Chloroflexota bacterium]